MIDCLSNFIGLRGIASYEDPDSGYFINDLQGITTDQLENIGDTEDHYEPRLVWDDIYARASRKLETDIRLKLTKYAKSYSYLQTTITSQLTGNSTITQSSDWSGWRFKFGYESKHLVLNLTEFQLYLNTAVNFSIYIYDFTTGEKLSETSYVGEAGLRTYRFIDLKNIAAYKHQDIFICYDANLVDTVKMADYKVDYPCTSGKVSKSGTITAGNFSSSSETGLSITYNLECSISNVVCQSIQLFQDAFLYLLGYEYCNERIYSDKINRWTLMDRDEAVMLRDEFKVEYDSLLTGALQGFKIDSDGVCFECNKAVNYKTMLP